jgi:GntR family transcriptional regulator
MSSGEIMSKGAGARYEQIADHLRGLVAELVPGDRLPSDAELCDRFGVSRMTARQAVQVLVAEDLVVRKRGAGTFVSATKVLRQLGSPLSFTESMRRRGLEASSKLLERSVAEASGDERRTLDLAPGDLVCILERIRLADGIPMAIERAVIPDALIDSFHRDIPEGSLHLAFEEVGHIPTRALAEVTARKASSRERELLGLSPGEAVLLCEDRVIWDQDDVAIEHTVTCYKADRYSFEAMLYRGEETR